MTEVLLDPGTERRRRHGAVVAGADEPNIHAPTLCVERNELYVPAIRAHGRTDVVQNLLDLVERAVNGCGAQITRILARVGALPCPEDTSMFDVPEGPKKVGFRRPAVNESRAGNGARLPPLRAVGRDGVR